MKKISILITAIMALLVLSCGDGDMLDPAKGIDSLGDTTLLYGTVKTSSYSPTPTYVLVYKTNSNSYILAKIPIVNGEYAARVNLSSITNYCYLHLASGTTIANEVSTTTYPSSKKQFYSNGSVDYDSDRQSEFDTMYEWNF